MKTKLLFLFVLLFQIGNAQNISFTDPVLKDLLVNSYINYNDNPNIIVSYPPIDSNDDGEISEAEALNVIGLNLSYSDISSLEGLQYFTNIKKFFAYCPNFPTFNQPTLVNLEQLVLYNFCGSGILATVNISSNINLKKFECSSTAITALDLSSNTSLESVVITCPELTSVNFSNLINLKFLSYTGKVPTIDLSDATNLLFLACYGNSETYTYPDVNLLTSIDLSNQTKLVFLELSGNNLTSLNLNTCINLEEVNISKNKINTLAIENCEYVKSLKCDDNLLTSLNVDSMFNLQSLYCSNNQLNSLSTKNGIIEDYIYFSGNPALTSVCCDENEVVYMQNQCLLNGNDTTTIDSNCGNATLGRISMYPNPVTDMLHLDSTHTITKIEVFAMSGLMVMNDAAENNVVNLSELQSGIYFVKVYVGDNVSTMKFSKM